MTSFKVNLEATIEQKGEFRLPPELEEAYFISKGVSWQDYRNMPKQTIERTKYLWYLQDLADKANNRKTKPKKK